MGLTVDFPDSYGRPEVAALHQNAIAEFERLVIGLRDRSHNLPALWNVASDAANRCLNIAD